MGEMKRSAAELPDLLIGEGFYKLGYVTTDREQAIEELSSRLGISNFFRFEPKFDALLADGRSGPARLRCAFSAGRDIFIEVMEPVDGLIDLWADPLAQTGFDLQFHHTGVLVDDLDAALKSAADRGLEPALRSDVPGRIDFAYLALPGLGHHVELAHQYGEGAAMLEGVRHGRLRDS